MQPCLIVRQAYLDLLELGLLIAWPSFILVGNTSDCVTCPNVQQLSKLLGHASSAVQ